MVTELQTDKQNKKTSLILTILKIVVIMLVAGIVLYLTNNFHYFEHIIEGVEYGIWHGFPLGFYFEGYHVNWGDGASAPIADWEKVSRWNYSHLAIDYVIYFLLVAGILYLAEFILKKIWRKRFKVTW